MLQRATNALRRVLFGPTATRSANLFDVARISERNKIRPSSDFARLGSMPILRNAARDSERNNPIAKALVASLVTNLVGVGIKPQLRGDAAAEFNRWTDDADFNGRYDFYGLQQAACRALVIDGECFVILKPAPHLRIPVQLQLLGSEHLDSSRVGVRTIEGIEYDEHGRRAAYWLYPKSPALAPMIQSVRLPADQVIHLFHPLQPGAERGVSWLAPVLLALNEIRNYCESERVRMSMAALFAAAIVTPDPMGSAGVGIDFESLAGQMKTQEVAPGSFTELKPGEQLEWNKPPEAGSSFEPFIRVQLRQVAAAHGVPYELLTGDVSQVTFASGRHALLEFRRRLEAIQHHTVIFQLCRPVIAAFLRFGEAAGALTHPPAANIIRWIAPLPEFLDSQGEVAAEVMRIRAGLKSRSEAVSAQCLNVDDVDREIAADNARADQLGLVLDSDARRVTMQGQAQQQGQGKPAAPADQQQAATSQQQQQQEKKP